MSNPTTKKTLAHLRRLGFIADVVERRLPGCFTTRDLLGIADIFAVHPGEHVVLLVQTTTADHLADRLRRIRGQSALPALLAAGVRVEAWGWRKCGDRWHVRRVAVQPETLEGVVIAELPDGRKKEHRKAGQRAPTSRRSVAITPAARQEPI
jgi:hypothetical protein